MEYRKPAHTDLKVSRLSFGTLTFGAEADEATSLRMVGRCLEAGINFFDTANVYNRGQSELILGKALAGRRHKVVIATKVRYPMGEGPDESGLSRLAIRKQIDASLGRLGTDYVDIYYFHQPDDDVRIEESLAAMDEAVRAGKVRYPAISNFAAWQICQMNWICQENGYRPYHISQPMYNVLARSIEDEYLAFCRRFGVAVVAYNPLAGGMLTGKHAGERRPSEGSRFHRDPWYLQQYWHSDYFAAVEELRAVARDAGKTLVELAFQWVLSQPVVDSIILGASRLEQLEQNLKACEAGPLDEATLARCEAVWRRLRGVTPKYNR